MWALVPLELVLELEVWLALRVFTSWLSTLANCSLVLLFWWGIDYEWVVEVGLLDVKLVVKLIARASSPWGLLSVGMILRPETGETIWLGWIVQNRDLGDDWPLWWIHLECCRAFSGQACQKRHLLLLAKWLFL